MQSTAEDLNALMSDAETTEVGRQFQVLTVLGKNEQEISCDSSLVFLR